MNLKLCSPWINLYNEIKAMFEDDSDICVFYEDNSPEFTIKLFVADDFKAAALDKLLVHHHEFGTVMAHVDVIPANCEKADISAWKEAEMFVTAFKDNPVLSYVYRLHNILQFDALYVVFKNAVVQYHNDDISDINGIRSCLYQDIAKDVFTEIPGVFYCTDFPNSESSLSGKGCCIYWP